MGVLTKPVYDIVRDCMKEYGHYAIENRALPSVIDGLKPSVRRILWAMYTMKVWSTGPSVKSGRIVGEAMGKYHPHGDSGIYGALVLLAHDKDPLIIPDGNFGDVKSYQKKKAAASRYTECRLSPLSEALFSDISVADMQQNYDATLKEPVVLPVPIPFSLVKGTEGIAVGLSTSIPPHNLGEVIDACCYLVDNPKASIKDLLRFIKGPDYGVGILTSSKRELLSLYESGEGSLSFASVFSTEKTKDGNKLVITELAPELHRRKNKLFDTSVSCFQSGLTDSPLTDESTVSSGYKFSIRYTDTKAINSRILPLLDNKITYRWYCLDTNGKPQKYNLKGILEAFIEYRRLIETRVLQTRLRKQRKALALLVARYKAAKHLDKVANILVTKTDNDQNIEHLKSVLDINDFQAEAILNSTLSMLSRASLDDLVHKIRQTKEDISNIRKDLADVDSVVKKHMLSLKKLGKTRGTKIGNAVSKIKDTSTSDTTYWAGITADGNISLLQDLPLKSKAAWPYVGFGKITNNIVLVYDTNTTTVTDMVYADKYEPQPGTVVGFSTKKYCLVVSDTKYVLFPTDQRRRMFNAFKQDAFPVFAVGLDDSDSVLLRTKNNAIATVKTEDLKATRPNVLPRSLGLRSPVTSVLVLPEKSSLVTGSGRAINVLTNTSKQVLFVVHESNLVILKSLKRVILSSDETIVAIKKKEVLHVVGL